MTRRLRDTIISAVSTIVSVAILVGCGGSQLPTGAMTQSRATAAHADGESWMLPEAKRDDLLYASGPDAYTYVFSYPPGKSVGRLDTSGNGLCSDNYGDVFLAGPYGSGLTEYAHGGTQAIAYLTIPNGEGGEVFGCGVDPTTGNLAATFECNDMSRCVSTHEIAVFPDASGTPVEYGGAGLPQFLYCGYDGAGNLFADGLPEYGSYLAELPAGSHNLKGIDFNKSIDDLGQIQWDGRYMTIQDRGRAVSYRLKISGSAAKIVGTTTFAEKGVEAQSWIQGRSIVIPYRRNPQGATSIGFWKYPAGGVPTKTISKESFGPGKFTGTTVSSLPRH